MPVRLRHPDLAPEAYAALTSLGHYLNTGSSLDPVLKTYVDLRASQVNGCEFCIAMHTAELRKHHEPQTRIEAVANWRDSDAFTPREKAAFAWTEVLTDLPHGSHASEADYAAVTEFFRDKELVDLTYAIANINAWNRLGVAFRPHFDAKHESASAPAEQPGGERSVVKDDGGKVSEE